MATQPRGSGFETKFMVDGKRYSGHHTTMEGGEAWELEQRARLKRGLPVLPASQCAGATASGRLDTLEALGKEADRQFWSGNPECRSAWQLYRNAELFIEWCGPKVHPAEALTQEKIEEYLTELHDKHGKSGSTVNRRRASILKMAGLAATKLVIRGRPMVRKWPEGQARERIFTEAEEKLLITVTAMWGYQDHADLWQFLIDTGCRFGETCRMPWTAWMGDVLDIPSHYRGADGKLHKLTKSGKGRVIALTTKAQAALARLKARHGDQPGPFYWVNKWQTRTLWDRLRGHFPWMDKQCVIHTFRHTCASRLVQEQGWLDPVQRWLGHVNPVTTQRYGKYDPKHMKELAGLLERRRSLAEVSQAA